MQLKVGILVACLEVFQRMKQLDSEIVADATGGITEFGQQLFFRLPGGPLPRMLAPQDNLSHGTVARQATCLGSQGDGAAKVRVLGDGQNQRHQVRLAGSVVTDDKQPLGRVAPRCRQRPGRADAERETSLPRPALPSSGIAGLDLRRFEEECLPLAVNASDLAEHARTVAERLAATRMIISVADPTPTIGGMLILGKRPQDFLPSAYVLFLRIAGTELSDEVVGEGICNGSVADLLRRLEAKLAAHNRPAVDLKSGAPEIHRSMFPLAALRQLVRNAVLHRTHAGTNAPVPVLRFEDRIAIISPGGLYGAVTARTFGCPGVVACRNPFLAEAMRVLGLVQGFGLGLQAAQSALPAAGYPELEFRVEPNQLHCAARTHP